MRFREMSKAKKIIFGVCILIMALSLFNIVWCFANLRIGHHSDEAWSYGFANSMFDPYIYCQINDDIYLSDATNKNINEWIPGKTFYDYIVVNEGEEFRYDSVYYNKSGDISAPLFEFILHTICSFFPETFSWWYAFSINIVCYLLIMYLILQIGKTICGEILPGALAASFYSLTLGCFNNIVYLRMYALMTVFSLWCILLVTRLIKSDFKMNVSLYIRLAICVIMGSFTHFYFLLMAFLLTFFVCISLLLRKKIKKCFCFGGFMLIAAGIFFLLFPSCIGRFLGVSTFYEDSLHYPYYINLRTVLDLFSEETLGCRWLITKVNLLYLLGIVIFFVITVFLVAFLLRNEIFVKNLRIRLTNSMKNVFAVSLPNFARRYYTGNEYSNEILTLVVISLVLIITKVSDIETMKNSSDRYLFAVMPIFIIIMFVYVYRLANKLRKVPKVIYSVIMTGVFVFSLFFQNTMFFKPYLFEDDNTDLITEAVADSNVIIVSNYSWRLEWYATEIMNADNVLFFSPDQVELCKSELMNIPSDKTIVLICEKDAFRSEKIIDDDGNFTINSDDAFTLSSLVNQITEEDFIDELRKVNARYDELSFVGEGFSFVGYFDIYK